MQCKDCEHSNIKIISREIVYVCEIDTLMHDPYYVCDPELKIDLWNM